MVHQSIRKSVSKISRPRWSPKARAQAKEARRKKLLPREPVAPDWFKEKLETAIRNAFVEAETNPEYRGRGWFYDFVFQEMWNQNMSLKRIGHNLDGRLVKNPYKTWVNWRMRRVWSQLRKMYPHRPDLS